MGKYSKYIFGKFACAIEKCIFYVSGEDCISTMIYWHNYIYRAEYMNTKLSISCGDPHT